MKYKIYDTYEKKFVEPAVPMSWVEALLWMKSEGQAHYKIVREDQTLEECATEHNMSLRDCLRHDEKEKCHGY